MRRRALAALSLTFVLAGCTTRQMDEGAIRRELGLPQTARTLVYAASPGESGWFGREGLKITMIFSLNPPHFDAWTRVALASGRWQPLPIPEAILKHLAGVRSAREARIRLAQLSGEPLPPEGSVYNPSEEQVMKRFRHSLPVLPPAGWYQIRTAGNDIMHAPKTLRATLDEDVNDFMLAVVDPLKYTVMVRVSTNY